MQSKLRVYMDFLNSQTSNAAIMFYLCVPAIKENCFLCESFLFLGAKAKAMINQSRENVARMVGGKAEDIIFTSGGTEVIITVRALLCSGFMKLHQQNSSVMHAAMVHGEQIFFQANNLVLHNAVEHFRRNCSAAQQGEGHQNGSNGLPHIITSNVEHDSVKLVAEHLQKDGKAGRRPSCKVLFRLIPGETDFFLLNKSWFYFNN